MILPFSSKFWGIYIKLQDSNIFLLMPAQDMRLKSGGREAIDGPAAVIFSPPCVLSPPPSVSKLPPSVPKLPPFIPRLLPIASALSLIHIFLVIPVCGNGYGLYGGLNTYEKRILQCGGCLPCKILCCLLKLL